MGVSPRRLVKRLSPRLRLLRHVPRCPFPPRRDVHAASRHPHLNMVQAMGMAPQPVSVDQSSQNENRQVTAVDSGDLRRGGGWRGKGLTTTSGGPVVQTWDACPRAGPWWYDFCPGY